MSNPFVVPYNFIPLLKERASADEEEGTYTGVINYSLLTKTELFIPNSSNDHAFPRHNNHSADHKSYDFFSYDDLSGEHDCEDTRRMPVIPGTEMRGVLRSTYEILTNSCFSSVNDQTQMSKRTMESFKPALIERTDQKNKEGNFIFNLIEGKTCIARFTSEGSLHDDPNTYCKFDKRSSARPDHNGIYPDGSVDARRIHVKSYRQPELKEGQCVSFEYNGRGSHVLALARNIRPYDNSDDAWGYVIKGTDFSTKHCLHVICMAENASVLSDIKLGCLHKALKTYKDNENPENGTYREYSEELKKFENGEGGRYFPVYYNIPGKEQQNLSAMKEKDKEYLMLSPAQKTREIYNIVLADILGTYQPCSSKDKLCPACSLFGTVVTRHGQDSYARASKVRVTDLCADHLDPDACYDSVRNLVPLGSPKRNNMEFYLKRPADDAYFWTYEYYIDFKGRLVRKKAEVNGRKFYWHHSVNPAEAYVEDSDEKNGKLNVSIRPLKAGALFHGKVYFQNITRRQLDQLIWILNTGDNANIRDHTYGLKIGMAKPLGFGSVSTAVDSVQLRTIRVDTETRKIVNEDQAYQWTLDDSVFTDGNEELEKNLENFKKASSFDAVKNMDVTYPYINKDEEGFQWYVNNHGTRNMRKDPRKIFPKGMPVNRQSMVYLQYMEAMNPFLQKVGGLQENSSDSKPAETHQGNEKFHKQGGFQKKTTVLDSAKINGEIQFFDVKKSDRPSDRQN